MVGSVSTSRFPAHDQKPGIHHSCWLTIEAWPRGSESRTWWPAGTTRAGSRLGRVSRGPIHAALAHGALVDATDLRCSRQAAGSRRAEGHRTTTSIDSASNAHQDSQKSITEREAYQVLLNVDPVLTGEMLAALDAMGHGDSVVVADAHFPAARLARKRWIDVPGLGSPRVLAAIRTVVLPDTDPGLDLMECPDGVLPVQHELIAAAQLTLERTRLVDRYAFYDLADAAELIVRTGEARIYANALLRKGVTPEWRA